MSVATYDPKQIALVLGGVLVTGYGENSIVSHARNSDSFTKRIGADGKVTRTRSADRSGRITITLQQSSTTNLVLSALLKADELGEGGTVPYLMKDNNGTTVFSSGTAWITRLPDDERANEAGDIEWTIDVSEMEAVIGDITQE